MVNSLCFAKSPTATAYLGGEGVATQEILQTLGKWANLKFFLFFKKWQYLVGISIFWFCLCTKKPYFEQWLFLNLVPLIVPYDFAIVKKFPKILAPMQQMVEAIFYGVCFIRIFCIRYFDHCFTTR